MTVQPSNQVYIVGVFFVEENRYEAYRGDAIPAAIRLIETADEVVTYNGEHHDLRELGKLAGVSGNLPIRGEHCDMRQVCWSDRIWGMSLDLTYSEHFDKCPEYPNTHEGSNERDCYMTFKLWELWKQGKLKFLDGHRVC